MNAESLQALLCKLAENTRTSLVPGTECIPIASLIHLSRCAVCQRSLANIRSAQRYRSDLEGNLFDAKTGQPCVEEPLDFPDPSSKDRDSIPSRNIADHSGNVQPKRVPCPEAALVAAYAKRVLNLVSASLGDEYRYQSLPLCVIDAVFSIGVRYEGTRRVVIRYCEHTNQRRIRSGEALPSIAEQESINTFCNRPEQADLQLMAERVYGNRQRTSTKNGILKAEAALRFAQCLRSHGVHHLQDVPHVANSARFEDDIRRLPGQDSGLSLQYFWMLAGSEDFIKADRMVLRFLQAALSRPVSPNEATPLMQDACKLLGKDYPQLTPRLLDHEVWKHQRASKNQSC